MKNKLNLNRMLTKFPCEVISLSSDTGAQNHVQHPVQKVGLLVLVVYKEKNTIYVTYMYQQ